MSNMGSKATRIEKLRSDIEHLESLVNTGATEIVEDGRVTKVDLPHCRKRLRELRAQLARLQGKRVARPVFGTIDTSGMQ